MNAHEKRIKDILNGARMLEIPYYQRAYVWNIDLWKRFLDDIIELAKPNSKPHFIGSIILKQQQTPSMGGVSDIRTVIDGQQRLTTIAIFFKTLSLKLNQPWIFEDICKCRSLVDGIPEMILAMRHNHIDKEAFEQVMALTEPVYLCFNSKGEVTESDSQIINAYQYFLKEIDTAVLDVKSYYAILDKILIVGIDLTYDEDEQQIFDTINSLGVKLTTSELLKNYFFDANNYSDYEKYWKTVFETDKEQRDYWDQEIVSGVSRPHLIDVFFAAYLTLKTHNPVYKVSTEDKLRFSRSEKLFESYKDFIGKYLGGDKSLIMREVREYAQLFMDNFHPDCTQEALTEQVGLDRINVIMFGLKMSTMIPYMLYVLVNQKSHQEVANICSYLESYVMRRIICHADTRGYYQLFSDRLISKEVYTAEDLVEFFDSKGEDRLIVPCSDEDVQESIHNKVLVNDQNTGILYMLETRLRSTALSATMMKGISYYTLEHLMPKKWMQTWDKTNLTEEEIAERNIKLYTLGNLAIIPGKLNTSISNNTWNVKLNGKSGRPGLIMTASGLCTLEKYLKFQEWDEKCITKRADDLYESILKVWK